VPPAASGSSGGLALAVVLYVAARVVLVAVITGVLVLVGLPLLLALIVALIVALPLSLIVFRPLRTRLNRGGHRHASSPARPAPRRAARRSAVEVRSAPVSPLGVLP
jgi:O-antigen ligase